MSIKLYTRSDGKIAEAEQYTGQSARELNELVKQLEANDFAVSWHPEKPTGIWEEIETDVGDIEIVEIVDHEHLELRLDQEHPDNFDRVNIGDYIVKRDDSFYVMQEELFESIWTEVLEIV